ncbi:MAG: 3-deoxy-manno-octulosonate cytidylyltransferase [bacterium]|nr:3-deoxy-manno-octulosonate cytidylyltransferase [bacterium]
MSRKVVAVIPARLGSSRFPGKVLHRHKGKPLLYHFWKQIGSGTFDRLVIATDNREIAEAARAFGAEVVMTSMRHRTGTDRVAEAVRKLGGDIIVNVQADNFGLRGSVVAGAVKKMLANPKIRFATLARTIKSDDALFNPNVVKVIRAADGRALWFSRYPLPYLQKVGRGRRSTQFKFLEHLGVYFFRRRALETYAGWKRGAFEKAESLEQLRVLENGERMQVFETTAKTVSIDSPQDVKKIARIHM